ncbi:MAG: prepilin-type N-terminal cleavage/methylation domain-containing protein [Planctomycetota bacterium]|nr:prepilin-type N-terminal cleavage/methylation domain-containing protein [Planctomycetota bacterium]
MRNPHRHSRAAFTLIELLVVMGILVVLAVLTGISVNQVSREARLSSGVNQVVAALGAARSYAIQNNATVMLTFVVSVDPEDLAKGETVELVLAKASGELSTSYDDIRWYDERYVPIPGLSAVQLPRGIKVAGPLNTAYQDVGGQYGDPDELWVSQPGGQWRISNGNICTEEIGRQIGVVFAPDGTLVTRNVMGAGGSGAVVWPYLDADRNRKPVLVNEENYGGVLQYVAYDGVGDECDAHPVQWLAVFDDEALRVARGDQNWKGEDGEDLRNSAITDWVDQFGVPIFFNRYTGVAEVSKP